MWQVKAIFILTNTILKECWKLGPLGTKPLHNVKHAINSFQLMFATSKAWYNSGKNDLFFCTNLAFCYRKKQILCFIYLKTYETTWKNNIILISEGSCFNMAKYFTRTSKTCLTFHTHFKPKFSVITLPIHQSSL